MGPKLILMRHGRSAWNGQNLFTGWVDIPLDETGIAESIKGGEKIRDLPIDVIFTSTLIRSQMTVVLSLLHHASGKVPVFLHEGQGKQDTWGRIYSEETKQKTFPVYCREELNERMYGKLQGMNKAQIAEQFGAAQVQTWRRSFDATPPDGESLSMTAGRTLPYFQQRIVPYLEAKKTVLVTAHGNSLRSIVMQLDRLSKEEVLNLEIPTGEVIIYEYEKGQWSKT